MNKNKKSTQEKIHEYWKIAGKLVDEYMSAKTDYLISLVMDANNDIDSYVEALAIFDIMYDIDKMILPLQRDIEHKKIKKFKVKDASILKIEIKRTLLRDNLIIVFLFPDDTQRKYIYPLDRLNAFKEEDKEEILYQKKVILGIIKMLKEYRIMNKLSELQNKRGELNEI